MGRDTEELPGPVRRLLERSDGPVLLVHGTTPPPLPTSARLVRVQAGDPEPRPGRHPAVLLVLADAAEVRRAASALAPTGWTRRLVLWLGSADRAPGFAPSPLLPPLRAARAELTDDGGAVLDLRFQQPAKVTEVVAEVARQVAPALPLAPPVLGVLAGDPADTLRGAPPADPAYQVLTRADLDADEDPVVPVDVLLAAEPPGPLPTYAVTGRSPAVVTDPALLAGPLDEGLFNPVGFVRNPSAGVVDLATLVGGQREPSLPALVLACRDHTAVRVDWSGAPLPELTRTVAALAMAGVPLLPAPPESAPPAAARSLLGDPLAALLQPNASAATDLGDRLRREEHSVRLRRAAHSHHASWAWRRRVAAAAGVPGPADPTVSVLLATKRPEQVDHALRQVARQRGVSVELVLAAHGHRRPAAGPQPGAGQRGAPPPRGEPVRRRAAGGGAGGVRRAAGEDGRRRLVRPRLPRRPRPDPALVRGRRGGHHRGVRLPRGPRPHRAARDPSRRPGRGSSPAARS